MDLTGFGSAFDFLNGVVERIWPDKTKQEEFKAQLAQAQLAGSLKEIEDAWANAGQQIEVNKVEAASTNLFIAGWRPFIGWIGGCAYGWTFIVQPMLTWAVLTFGSAAARVAVVTMPHLDMGPIGTMTMGLLGLVGARTFEKWSGTENRR